MKKLLALLLLAPMVAAGSPIVLYDNGSDPTTINAAWTSSPFLPAGVTWQVWDDFTLPTGADNYSVSGLDWGGTYFAAGPIFLSNAVGVAQTFEILFATDNGTGAVPTNLDATSGPLGAGSVLASRTVTATSAGAGVRLSYSAVFAPLMLAANTRYWVSVNATSLATLPTGPQPDGWSWTGDNNTGNSLQAAVTSTGATGLFLRNTTQSFSVVGMAVPEPATLALLALGLAGIGLARRRRT